MKVGREGDGGGVRGTRGRIVDAACVQSQRADVTSLLRPSQTPKGDALHFSSKCGTYWHAS